MRRAVLSGWVLLALLVSCGGDDSTEKAAATEATLLDVATTTSSTSTSTTTTTMLPPTTVPPSTVPPRTVFIDDTPTSAFDHVRNRLDLESRHSPDQLRERCKKYLADPYVSYQAVMSDRDIQMSTIQDLDLPRYRDLMDSYCR
jgi:hypothetical protein